MAEQLNLQVNVTGNANESVGSLKKELREAQAQVAILSDKFGVTSKEAIEAAKRAAELKDRIGDAKALTDAFNPDAKFKALTASLSGVAGGFAAVQGAIGLFGGESKELEKQLLKVQSALALSQGLQAVGESIDSFKQLGAVIKNQVVTAFSTLKGAIIATGLGALAVALGFVISNFEDVKTAINNLFPGFEKFTKFIGGIVEKFTDFVGITSEAERNLEALEKQTKRGNEAIESRIKILNAQGGKEKEVYQLSKKLGEDELNFLREKLKTKGKLSDEELKQFRDLKVQQEILDIQEQNRLNKLAEERAKKNKEVQDKEIQRIAALDKKAEENKIRLINLNNQEKEQQKKKIEDQKKEDEKEAEKQNKNVESIVARAKATVAGIVAQNDYLRKQDEDNAKAKVEAEKAKQNAIGLTAQAIGGLSEVVGRDTAAGKLFASAQALINTYLGATQVLSDKTLPTVAKIAGVASVLASGFVAVRNINKVQVPGQSSGGLNNPQSAGLSPFVPQSASPTQTITQLNQASINAIGNQAIRAYVVESDMTSSQKRIEAIKQKAKFG